MIPIPSNASAKMAIQMTGMCFMYAAIARAAMRMIQPTMERLNQFTGGLHPQAQQWECLLLHAANELRDDWRFRIRTHQLIEFSTRSVAHSAPSVHGSQDQVRIRRPRRIDLFRRRRVNDEETSRALGRLRCGGSNAIGDP